MKEVTTAYKESMRSNMRNPSHARISFGNVDTTASTDGTWSANSSHPMSEVATLDYDFKYKESVSTLELNHWTLDGSNRIRPISTVNDGFVSQSMSDADGHFTSQVIMTRQFAEPHVFPGLTLTFDSRQREWPTAVTVEFYNQGQLADSKRVVITDVSAVFETKADTIDKLIVKFESALPYRRIRLEKTLYGIIHVYTNKDIISTKQSNDVDPLCRRLPSEKFNFTILDYNHNYDPDNPIGIYAYVDKHSPVEMQFGYELDDGSIEWLKSDKYVLRGRPKIKDNKATFEATGILNSMSDTYYKSKVGTKSLYDMAEDVLLDANLPLSKDGTHPWVINTGLRNLSTTAVLPIGKHSDCLQLIAHAACSKLYTDDDNIIHIEPFGITRHGIYNGIWDDNGHLWYSEWDTVDRGSTAPNTNVTLELNRWTLDGGEQVVIADDKPTPRGFVGSAISNDNGTYSVAPLFVKTFDTAHDLQTLSIRFDRILKEYPVSIRVRYYRGASVISTKTVSVKSYETTVFNNSATDCTGFDVSVVKTLPGYRLRVEKVFYRDTDFSLNFTTIRERGQAISKIDQLKSVEVSVFNHTVSDTSQEIFKGTTTGTTLHCVFSGLAQNVQINVSGGSVVSSKIYGRAADLVLSSGTKTVIITGQTLSENSVVVSYPVSKDGEIDKEENPLITSNDMAMKLANHVSQYLQMRNTYNTTYRGNPEMETGDTIGLQTPYTDEMDGLVLVDEITFDGSLSGKMTVKGLI